MKTITHAELIATLRAQGVPSEHMAVKCCMCGTVQSPTSLIRAGAGETLEDVNPKIGFSCVGRWQGGPGPTEAKEKGVACNWTLGGLFKTHKLEILTENGDAVPFFDPATPDEAQELMRRHEETPGANLRGKNVLP